MYNYTPNNNTIILLLLEVYYLVSFDDELGGLFPASVRLLLDPPPREVQYHPLAGFPPESAGFG